MFPMKPLHEGLALVIQSCHLISAHYFLLELAKTTLQRKTFHNKSHSLLLYDPWIWTPALGLLPLVPMGWEDHHKHLSL